MDSSASPSSTASGQHSKASSETLVNPDIHPPAHSACPRNDESPQGVQSQRGGFLPDSGPAPMATGIDPVPSMSGSAMHPPYHHVDPSQHVPALLHRPERPNEQSASPPLTQARDTFIGSTESEAHPDIQHLMHTPRFEDLVRQVLTFRHLQLTNAEICGRIRPRGWPQLTPNIVEVIWEACNSDTNHEHNIADST